MCINISQIEKELKLFKKKDEIHRKLFALRRLAQGWSQKDTALKEKVCSRTIARWTKVYLQKGPEALAAKPKIGRPRKGWIRGKLAKRILKLRRKYQWGAEVIAAHLKKWDNIEVSEYRVYELLKAKKVIRKVRKQKKKNTHTKKVKVDVPGAHTQMDVRHLDGRNDKGKRYVYNFVDHASKWSYKEVFDGYGAYYTEKFFLNLLAVVPFTILRLQLDNGTEFTNRFIGNVEHILEKICREKGIRVVFIPPGEKELQGLVEGHHRIDKDEFFDRMGKQPVHTVNAALKRHLEFKNSKRGYKVNQWRSPNEYLWDNLVAFTALYKLKYEQLHTDESTKVLMAA